MASRRQEILPPAILSTHVDPISRFMTQATHTCPPCPATLIYCPHQPLTAPQTSLTACHSPVTLPCRNMEFVEHFLSLQPELMFTRAEADVKTNNTLTVTLVFAAVFIAVLILLIIFVGRICRCKSQAEQSTETPVPEQITVL